MASLVPILFRALGGDDMVTRNLPPQLQGIANLLFNPVNTLLGIPREPNLFGEQIRRGIAENLPQRIGDIIAPERVYSPEQQWASFYDPVMLEDAEPFEDLDFLNSPAEWDQYGPGLMTGEYGGSVQPELIPGETYDEMGNILNFDAMSYESLGPYIQSNSIGNTPGGQYDPSGKVFESGGSQTQSGFFSDPGGGFNRDREFTMDAYAYGGRVNRY